MSIIEEAMEKQRQLTEEARATEPAAAESARAAPPATTPEITPQPRPLKLEFLKADRTSTNITIEIPFEGAVKDDRGALTEQFKQACATAVAKKLPGIKSDTLKDARSVQVFRPTHTSQLERVTVDLMRFVGWMVRHTPANYNGALTLKLKNAFGPTPPWAPQSTWEKIVPKGSFIFDT